MQGPFKSSSPATTTRTMQFNERPLRAGDTIAIITFVIASTGAGCWFALVRPLVIPYDNDAVAEPQQQRTNFPWTSVSSVYRRHKIKLYLPRWYIKSRMDGGTAGWVAINRKRCHVTPTTKWIPCGLLNTFTSREPHLGGWPVGSSFGGSTQHHPPTTTGWAEGEREPRSNCK